jgi:hypothetical protein
MIGALERFRDIFPSPMPAVFRRLVEEKLGQFSTMFPVGRSL